MSYYKIEITIKSSLYLSLVCDAPFYLQNVQDPNEQEDPHQKPLNSQSQDRKVIQKIVQDIRHQLSTLSHTESWRTTSGRCPQTGI